MTKNSISSQHHQTFESIRQLDENGNESWLARELAPLLDYQGWRNFQRVLEKAKIACSQSGYAVDDHFVDINKMVEIGSSAHRQIDDVQLSRYACYLIVQNGDQERFSQISEDERRLMRPLLVHPL